MSAALPIPLIVLTGQTASGKEAAGVELAERLGAEIVTVDAFKVYRGLDIGTAKATAAQRARVMHHGLDLAEPYEVFSAGRWLAAAEAAIADIHRRGRRVLLVGGTALYLKVLGEGLMEGPASDAALREALHEQARREGAAALHARLAVGDPASAARLHPNDLKRVVRAIEVLTLTGRPLSDQQRQWNQPNPRYAITWLGLRRDPGDQRDRIARRVAAMMTAGLVEEVAGLLAVPGRLGPTAAEAVGYREVAAHLAGQQTRQAAMEAIVLRTGQFAKRQRTWLQRFPTLQWFDVAPHEPPPDTAARLAESLARRGTIG